MEEEKEIIEALKADESIAENWVIHYQQRKNEYYEAERYIREDIPSPSDLGHGSGIASPTEMKFIKLSDLDEAESWLLVVELMERLLSPKQVLFLELRRRAATRSETLQSIGKGKINYFPIMTPRDTIKCRGKNKGIISETTNNAFTENKSYTHYYPKNIIDISNANQRGKVFLRALQQAHAVLAFPNIGLAAQARRGAQALA